MSQELNKVVAAFAGEKAGDSWRGKCPVCGHKSLLIKEGDKQPVVAWCSRECDKKSVNAAVYKAAGMEFKPFTVAQFCEMKKLPPDYVSAYFAVHDGFFKKKTGERSKTSAVCFPYLGEVINSETLEHSFGGLKYRFSESSHDAAWQDYKKPMLYGLHMLPHYEADLLDTSVIVLCEGESDTITLAYNGICAFGIPGAPHGWNNQFAKLEVLQNAKRILVIQEPDDAGAKLATKIAACFPDKVWLLKLPVKDPSALWIQENDKDAFSKAWQAAVAGAQPQVPIVVDSTRTIEEEPLPQFPQFTGSLGELSAALYPDLPHCHKFMTALTLLGASLSGKVYLSDAPYLDPRFYTVLIDVGGAGKGGAWSQVRDALVPMLGDLCIKASVESGPALVQHLAQKPRTCLFSDELSGLFEKAKVTGTSKNTLFTELLTLYEGHETENDAKSNLALAAELRDEICKGSSIRVTNAHLSMLGLVQPLLYQTMWGGTKGGSSGLQSRFVLASSGQLTVPEPQTPSDSEKVSLAIARIKGQIERYTSTEESPFEESNAGCRTIYRPPEIGQRQRDWWVDHMAMLGASSRLPALMSRFALLLAITNDCEEITPDIFEQVLAFGEYQIQLCARFNPSDSVSYVHAFEDLIIRMFQKHGDGGLTFRQVRQYVNPEQKKLLGGYGPFWTAWNNLLRVERLIVIGGERTAFYGLQN